MAEILSVPFSPQEKHGYCLPACAQMVLAYLGISRSQKMLARELEVFEDFGVPASNITKLKIRSLKVIYTVEGTFANIENWLQQRTPVIVFVQTAQLEYWQRQTAQHAVLIVGMNNLDIFLLDPGREQTVITVSKAEFTLAWDEMEFSCATITKQ